MASGSHRRAPMPGAWNHPVRKAVTKAVLAGVDPGERCLLSARPPTQPFRLYLVRDGEVKS